MATKQTTQLCYQVNGGTCRNKVSAKNSYICAARHGATKGMGRDEIATQLPIEAIRKMDSDTQCELATNPSIDRDTAIQLAKLRQALFDTGDDWMRRNLASNPSIDRDIAQALFETKNWTIREHLAKNPSIDRDIQQALFDTGDDWMRRNLATNPSIDRDIAQALFDTGDEWAKRNLASNPSIDREMAIALAKDGHTPSGYLKNKSITELYSGENVSLINEYPKEFGQAYLDHLLGSDEDLDQMKTLLCYSYDCYRKASGSNPKDYKELILEKYPNDEEVKILLS